MNLKDIAEKYGLGYSRIHDSEVIELTSEIPFEEIEQRILAQYARLDAEVTLEFRQKLLPAPIMPTEFKGFKQGELPATEFMKQLPKPYYTPVYVDYIKSTGSVMSNEQIKSYMEEIWKMANAGSSVGFDNHQGNSTPRPYRSLSEPSMDSDDTIRSNRQYPHEAPRWGRLCSTREDTSKVRGRGQGRDSKG